MIFWGLSIAEAKKYKWTYNDHPSEVYTLGVGQNGRQLVKTWAIGKNANKAILQAKMDAVSAALFCGISPDPSTNGMGVANLPALVSRNVYEANKEKFIKFFTTGEFLNYVNNINSDYPTGENNLALDGGNRLVGINLSLDYRGLKEWLMEKDIIKGVGGHFN